MSSRSILLILSHLRVDLTSGLFPAGFPPSSLCAFLLSALRSTRHSQLICDLVILMAFGEEQEPLSSVLGGYLVPLITSPPFLGPNSLLSTLLWNTL
jgi:hypothetical protein